MNKILLGIKEPEEPFMSLIQKSRDDNSDTRLDFIKFTIERFDGYYDAVNNKGAFYIGLNTFVFSGLCVGYLGLYEKVEPNLLLWILFLCTIISNISSIAFTLFAIMPFLKNSQNKNDLPSLFYFGGISKHTFINFKEKFYKANETLLLDDLTQQAYCLATGLEKKYNRLKNAGVLLLIQFSFILPIFYLIIKNLHS